MYIDIESGVEAKLDVKGEVTFNSNGFAGMYPFLDPNSKLDIVVDNSASLNLDQNGSNAFRNSGFYANVYSVAELIVDVKGGGSFKSCGNTQFDISGEVVASATATFSGTGYTCDQAVFNGGGTVVGPVCQDCT